METSSYRDICMSCMHKYVGIQTSDGMTQDGFIAHVDNEYVTLAIPSNEMIGGMPMQQQGYRQFGYYPGFYPRRRFYQRRFPLAALTGLFLLPFFL
ncbi:MULTISPECIES: phosphatidylinositol kinase [Paenibacillus]|uniref:phosphatidylinositol kinase n=1 Tax=Paenibacillus TaxID=44249 RepID=UPI00203F146C|nr:phosphatidylinositol kinase [Paenibacillus camelliae]MCM3632848.1 phosphatidylinositol kinase [Paenibacillus camelliae]